MRWLSGKQKRSLWPVEIDELAPPETIREAQSLVDRVCAMLTRLIRSTAAVDA